jgi:arylsulfatase A-like enzyme
MNILFILTDQFRFDCLGALGHPLVETPNLDALASTSARSAGIA